MMRKNNIRPIPFALLITIGLLSGCTWSPDTLAIPEAPAVGGYEIQTDTMRCTLLADGDFTYSQFESYAEDRTVTFYAGPTELILTDTAGTTTQYYMESCEDSGEVYANPLQRVYDELRELNFTYQETADGFHVYEAVQTTQTVTQEQIGYTAYTIELDWLDESHYTFLYYIYADGATLISAEAPSEINPLLDADTAWVIDLDSLCIRSEETGQQIPFTVTSTASGKGISPNASGTAVESQRFIYAYVNTETEQIEKLRYADGAEVTVLYTADIQKPQITQDMTEMGSETLQLDMMLISILESLI